MYASELVSVATRGEIMPGQMKVAEINGVAVVVVNLEGEYCAFEATCPHRHGPLHQGYIGKDFLRKDFIECPWHHFRYDIRTGENIFPKNVYPNIGGLQRDLRSLRTWRVEVEEQDIKLRPF